MKREMKLNSRHLFEFPTLEITGAQPELFQGTVGFVELGHFHKHFVKNTRK